MLGTKYIMINKSNIMSASGKVVKELYTGKGKEKITHLPPSGIR